MFRFYLVICTGRKISKIGRGLLGTLNIKVAAVGFTGSRDQSTTNRQLFLCKLPSVHCNSWHLQTLSNPTPLTGLPGSSCRSLWCKASETLPSGYQNLYLKNSFQLSKDKNVTFFDGIGLCFTLLRSVFLEIILNFKIQFLCHTIIIGKFELYDTEQRVLYEGVLLLELHFWSENCQNNLVTTC